MKVIDAVHKRIILEHGLKKLFHRILFKMMKPILAEISGSFEDIEIEKIKIQQNQKRLDLLESRVEDIEIEKVKIQQNQKRLDSIESRLMGYEENCNLCNDLDSRLKVMDVILDDGIELKMKEMLEK